MAQFSCSHSLPMLIMQVDYKKHTITIKYLYFLNICYNYVRFQKKSDYHLLQVITDNVARPMQGDHLTNFSWQSSNSDYQTLQVTVPSTTAINKKKALDIISALSQRCPN